MKNVYVMTMRKKDDTLQHFGVYQTKSQAVKKIFKLHEKFKTIGTIFFIKVKFYPRSVRT